MWHHLRLEIAGPLVVAYLNGDVAFQYDGLTDYTTGRIGLGTTTGGYGEGRFDNVVVTAIPYAFSVVAVESQPFFTVRWSPAGPPGYAARYTVDYHDGDGSWLPVPPADQWPITATDFSDPTAAQAWVEQGRRFYRVRAEAAE